MTRWNFFWLFLALLAATATATAQGTDSGEDNDADGGAGTLPGVEVRPDPATPSMGEPSFAPGTGMPIEPGFGGEVGPGSGGQPSVADSLPNLDYFDAPSYPDLEDLTLDRLDGAFRASRSIIDDPRFATIIDRDRIVEKTPIDMFDALQNEVGVLIQRTQRGAAAPFVRGLTGQQVLLLIDGVRINNATTRLGPNQYFNLIDPGMVERIEVVRGPQSAIWGSDAIGGVINVVTRSAGNRFTQNYVGGELLNRFSTADLGYYGRTSVEGSLDRTAVFGGASYLNLNNLDRGGDLGRQPGTGYQQYAGDIKLNHLVDTNNMLTVSLQHFEQEDLFRSDRLPGRQTIFNPQQRDLGYIRMEGRELPYFFDSYQFTASWHRFKETREDQRLATTNLDVSEFDTQQTGLNLLMSSDMGGLGRFNYGVDWWWDDVDSFAKRFNADTGAFLSDRTPPYPDDSQYEQFGAFGQWDVMVTDRLLFLAGVRYNNVDVQATPIVDVMGTPTPVFLKRTYNDVTGSVGLNLAISEEFRWVGSISEGWRAPNIDDLAANNSNVQQSAVDTPALDLRPENSVNFETGFKFNYPRLRGQVVYFWTDIDGYIQRTPSGTAGPDQLFSRTNRDSTINGLEMQGEYLLGQGLSLFGNFWYIIGDDLELQQPLSRIPPTQGIAGVRWRSYEGDCFCEFFGWFAADQERLNFQDIGDSRIPPGGTPGYAVGTIRAGGYLTEHQRITMQLENVFDTAYRVHGSGVDGPGINFIVGWDVIH